MSELAQARSKALRNGADKTTPARARRSRTDATPTDPANATASPAGSGAREPAATPATNPGRSRTTGGRIPLATVAERAGVSEATVSRVINRRYGVAPATRETVERVLVELGHHQQVKGSVVLVLTVNLLNPFFAAVAQQIGEQLEPAGLRTIIAASFYDTVQERDHLDALVDGRLAAVVFLAASNTLGDGGPVVDMVASRGVPFISINGGFTDRPSPVVSVDEWHAAELAVGHLHDLGHRRIGLCAGPRANDVAERRVDGFLQALERRDLLSGNQDLIVRRYFTVEGGSQAATQLLGRGVTALVASSDEMAFGAIRAVRKSGRTVPGDVSVIGFDDAFLLDFTDPPLTSVHLPVEEIAEQVALLIETIMAGHPVDDHEIFIEPSIRVRSTTGPPPAAAP